MTQVTFPVALGGDGLVYSDDGVGARDMLAGGHRTNFIPLLGQALLMANSAKNSANSAIGAANATGTSTTAVATPTIGGDTVVTTQAGKLWVAGMPVILADTTAPFTRWLSGLVKSYSGTTLTITVNDFSGSGWGGTNWTISLTGFARAQSMIPQTHTGAGTLAIVAADRGKYFRVNSSASITVTFPAASTLGSGWFCYVENVTAIATRFTATLDPNSTELIDGVQSFLMYPGEARLIVCDGAAFSSLVLNVGVAFFSSTASWTKPPGYSVFRIRVLSGGGGGGGGYGQNSANVRTGGAGGGGGVYLETEMLASWLLTTETATVGAGGTSGPGGNGTAGTAGGTGGTSAFKNVIAVGGAGGQGGVLNSSNLGGSGASPISNPSTAMNQVIFGVSVSAAAGGPGLYSGAGGSTNTSGVGFVGGASLYGGAGGGAGGGLSVGGVAQAAAGGGVSTFAGAGGAGGAANIAGVGTAGTVGAIYGGGGGGGGAGTTIGGAGGVGGAGYVSIEGVA